MNRGGANGRRGAVRQGRRRRGEGMDGANEEGGRFELQNR